MIFCYLNLIKDMNQKPSQILSQISLVENDYVFDDVNSSDSEN